MSRHVVLATGGTSGHVYPALALADRLKAEGVAVTLLGAQGGMEERLAADAGVTFHGVSAGKLDRSRPDPRQLLSAGQGVMQARKFLRKSDASLVIGFGGFASLPGALAASWSRTPLWLNEQNAFPGLVTRLLASRAELVVLNVADASKRVRARRTEVLPYPVDERKVDRATARRQLGLPEDGLMTLVMGGSQGSVALNNAVLQALGELGDEATHVLHATGPANVQDVLPVSARHHVTGYVDNVLAWSAADLAITRAGIGTLSMAALHGVPLIMVPLPSAAENHQHHNARAVADAGAGILLPQEESGGLAGRWRQLLDSEARAAAAAAQRSRHGPDGAGRLARLVLERLANGQPRGN